MAVVFVYNGHYIIMVLSLNDSLITNEQAVFDYICFMSYIFRPFTEDVFKWMPVDVYMNMVCIQ